MVSSRSTRTNTLRCTWRAEDHPSTLPGLCLTWAERQPDEGRGADSLLEGLLLAGDAHAGEVHNVPDMVR